MDGPQNVHAKLHANEAWAPSALENSSDSIQWQWQTTIFTVSCSTRMGRWRGSGRPWSWETKQNIHSTGTQTSRIIHIQSPPMKYPISEKSYFGNWNTIIGIQSNISIFVQSAALRAAVSFLISRQSFISVVGLRQFRGLLPFVAGQVQLRLVERFVFFSLSFFLCVLCEQI